MNLHACAVLSGKIDQGVIVTVLPDSGVKYLSKIYNDDWMNEKGFTGKEKKPEDGKSIGVQKQPIRVRTKSPRGCFRKNNCSLKDDTRKRCNDDEMNSREQSEAELRFLEETGVEWLSTIVNP